MTKFKAGDFIYCKSNPPEFRYGEIERVADESLYGEGEPRMYAYWGPSIENINKREQTRWGYVTDAELVNYKKSPLWKKLEGIK